MYLRSTPRRNKGRFRGPLPAARPQRVGPAAAPLESAGRIQLRPRGRREPRRAAAPGRPGHAVSRPAAALAATTEGLEFTESRPLGGTWALDALWSRLGISPAMRKLLKCRRLDDSAERVLFALVANRALAPSSKLGQRRRPDRRPARDQRRCLLPDDGLPAGDQGRAGEEGLR